MGLPDTQSSLAEPAPSGMMTSARFRGGLIALVVVEASWLVICGGLALPHRSGLPVLLFVVVGLIVAVATLVGWIRVTSEAAMAVCFLAYSVAFLAALVSAGVQLYRLLAGHPGGHGAVLGWAVLTAFLSLVAMFTVVGVLGEIDDRQTTVLHHARVVERLAGARWFGRGAQPPELLLPPLATPGVYAYELAGKASFRYAVVGATRVVLVCLAPPDDPEELAAEAASWQDRLRAADSGAQVRGVLVVPAGEAPGPPAGQMLALDVTPTTADGFLGTVGPWLGEPGHVSVPIAAVLMPAELRL